MEKSSQPRDRCVIEFIMANILMILIRSIHTERKSNIVRFNYNRHNVLTSTCTKHMNSQTISIVPFISGCIVQ
jgi:hypothetical protein